MSQKKTGEFERIFDDGELADRVAEAFERAAAAPAFKAYRGGLRDMSRKQEKFVELCIEEALRHYHLPTACQFAYAESEQRSKDRLHLTLTPAQRQWLLRLSQEEIPEGVRYYKKPKRMPHPTFRVLHSAGLVSAGYIVTELGGIVASNIHKMEEERLDDIETSCNS